MELSANHAFSRFPQPAGGGLIDVDELLCLGVGDEDGLTGVVHQRPEPLPFALLLCSGQSFFSDRLARPREIGGSLLQEPPQVATGRLEILK